MFLSTMRVFHKMHTCFDLNMIYFITKHNNKSCHRNQCRKQEIWLTQEICLSTRSYVIQTFTVSILALLRVKRLLRILKIDNYNLHRWKLLEKPSSLNTVIYIWLKHVPKAFLNFQLSGDVFKSLRQVFHGLK